MGMKKKSSLKTFYDELIDAQPNTAPSPFAKKSDKDPEEERKEEAQRKAEEERRRNRERVDRDTTYGVFKKKIILNVFVALLAVVMITILLLSFERTTSEVTYKKVLVNKTITYEPGAKISIQQFLTSKDGDSITVLGYLKEEYVQRGINQTYIYQYVSDDFGNKIRIVLSYASNRSIAQFIKNDTTTQTYTLTGIVKYPIDGITLEVKSIALAPRPTESYTRVEEVEETVPVTKGASFKIDISRGSQRFFHIFSFLIQNPNERKN
jgi:hypothetical protein